MVLAKPSEFQQEQGAEQPQRAWWGLRAGALVPREGVWVDVYSGRRK